MAARLANDGGEGDALALALPRWFEGDALLAAVADDVGEQIVRELHAAGADAILDPQ